MFTGGFDVIFDFKESKAFVQEFGWEAFLAKLRSMYPERNLYNVSQDWINYAPGRFACKARGTHGDLLIGWKYI